MITRINEYMKAPATPAFVLVLYALGLIVLLVLGLVADWTGAQMLFSLLLWTATEYLRLIFLWKKGRL